MYLKIKTLVDIKFTNEKGRKKIAALRELVYVSLAPQAKFLMILQSGMRFSKGKLIIWRSDFSKNSRSIFQEMLSLKVNSISTYSAGNAVSKGKLDICESADSGAICSLGDAKIFFNFGCPYTAK